MPSRERRAGSGGSCTGPAAVSSRSLPRPASGPVGPHRASFRTVPVPGPLCGLGLHPRRSPFALVGPLEGVGAVHPALVRGWPGAATPVRMASSRGHSSRIAVRDIVQARKGVSPLGQRPGETLYCAGYWNGEQGVRGTRGSDCAISDLRRSCLQLAKRTRQPTISHLRVPDAGVIKRLSRFRGLRLRPPGLRS